MLEGFLKFFLGDSLLEASDEHGVAILSGVRPEYDLVLAYLTTFEVMEDSICNFCGCIDNSSFAVLDSYLFPELSLPPEFLLHCRLNTLIVRSRSSWSSTGETIFKKSFLSVSSFSLIPYAREGLSSKSLLTFNFL